MIDAPKPASRNGEAIEILQALIKLREKDAYLGGELEGVIKLLETSVSERGTLCCYSPTGGKEVPLTLRCIEQCVEGRRIAWKALSGERPE